MSEALALPVPSLDGVLSTAGGDLAAASNDFGNRIRRRPAAVLHPASAADVAAVVRLGRENGLPVAARGAGHSVGGQALVRDGIVVALQTLGAVHHVGAGRMSVDAGAPWSTVVSAALRHGLVPPVLPDHLGLTVGGTLSVGGIGGSSHRYGCIADNVPDLDVVTPDGDLVTCSPAQNPELFDTIRATQGRHGIITRATLRLVPAHRMARRYLLNYRDPGALLADQRRVIADGRFDHVLGQARAGAGGVRDRWVYQLEAMVAYTPPGIPDDAALLSDLAYSRGTEEIASAGYADFLGRLGPVEEQLRAAGSWQHHPHPRCTVLLPARHAEAVVGAVLTELSPEELGHGGSILLYPIPTARLAAPHMARAADAVSVVFGLQRTAPPGDGAILARMRRDNAALVATAELLGGCGYCEPTNFHEERGVAAVPASTH